MAEHACPECNEKGFVWALDEEKSDLTQWYCSCCEYHSEENESLEKHCPKCKEKEFMAMLDSNSKFWYCTSCQFKVKKDW